MILLLTFVIPFSYNSLPYQERYYDGIMMVILLPKLNTCLGFVYQVVANFCVTGGGNNEWMDYSATK